MLLPICYVWLLLLWDSGIKLEEQALDRRPGLTSSMSRSQEYQHLWIVPLV